MENLKEMVIAITGAGAGCVDKLDTITQSIFSEGAPHHTIKDGHKLET